VIIISECRLNGSRQRGEVALVKYRLHELFVLGQVHALESKCGDLTYLFRSSFLALCLAPTIFLSILDIMSSLKTTISWLKNLIRHGLVPKCTCGILLFNRETMEERRGRRGRMELTVLSNGPGMKRK
jgi:hypothetical protein